MATKKTTTKKAPATKKPSTARKSTTRKSGSAKAKAPLRKLAAQIRLQPEESAFLTFRITRQTLYWLLLGVVVLIFTFWLTRLQSDIQDLYDQIDASTAEMSSPWNSSHERMVRMRKDPTGKPNTYVTYVIWSSGAEPKWIQPKTSGNVIATARMQPQKSN